MMQNFELGQHQNCVCKGVFALAREIIAAHEFSFKVSLEHAELIKSKARFF